jgi:hypothetical protein
MGSQTLPIFIVRSLKALHIKTNNKNRHRFQDKTIHQHWSEMNDNINMDTTGAYHHWCCELQDSTTNLHSITNAKNGKITSENIWIIPCCIFCINRVRSPWYYNSSGGHVSWIKLENRKIYFKMFAINIYCWTKRWA